MTADQKTVHKNDGRHNVDRPNDVRQNDGRPYDVRRMTIYHGEQIDCRNNDCFSWCIQLQLLQV
jgi:hypothetical protein